MHDRGVRTGDSSSPAARPLVRLLHTSDLHLSGDYALDRGIAALSAVADMSLRTAVDAVLIAGDFFDGRHATDEVIDDALEQLARLQVPVVVIPGNHDCGGDPSIYDRVDLHTAGPHVFFVRDPAGRHVVFEEHKLAVWARGIENHHPSHRPLDGYQPADPEYWRVILTHGHYVNGDGQTHRSSRINAREIAELECDYVALGHWHHCQDVSENGVTAYYSGSPSCPLRLPATVNIVELRPDTEVSVEPMMLMADPITGGAELSSANPPTGDRQQS